MTEWRILRTSPVQTIPLAEALKDMGIEAWTPTETVKPEPRRLEPWEKPVTRPKATKVITRPMLPTFVFADATRIGDLAEMSHSPVATYVAWDEDQRRNVTKRRPFFTLFAPDRPAVPDSALAPLRKIAGRRRDTAKTAPKFKKGDAVRLTEGAYAGLRGEVLSLSGKKAKVRFPGGQFDFDVYLWLLTLDEAADSDVSNARTEKRAQRHRNAA